MCLCRSVQRWAGSLCQWVRHNCTLRTLTAAHSSPRDEFLLLLVRVGVAHAYLTAVDGCEDVFTSSDLIPTAPTGGDFTYLLLESESFRGPDDDYTVDSAAMVSAGVPVNGTDNIVEEISSHLMLH